MELLIWIVRMIARSLEGAENRNAAAEQQRAEWERHQQAYWASQLEQVGQASAAPAGSMPPLPPLPPTRSKRKSAPPPLPGRPLATAPAVKAESIPTSAVKATLATAPAIARWMKPNTLRAQFILTEVLKPPLALRPPRDVGGPY